MLFNEDEIPSEAEKNKKKLLLVDRAQCEEIINIINIFKQTCLLMMMKMFMYQLCCSNERKSY